MKLKWFRVQEFQSVKDSGTIVVDDILCLVGKNEAGKSALLKALYRLNPIVEEDGKFDPTHDYPRMDVEDYRYEVESKRRKPAVPIEACYSIDCKKINEIEKLFGQKCIKIPEIELSKNYENEVFYFLQTDDSKSLKFLINNADFSKEINSALKSTDFTAPNLIAKLEEQEQTEEVKHVLSILNKINIRGLSGYIWDNILKSCWPKFLYFDEYYQITGHENIESLIQRESNKQLKASDRPMLGLIRLARLHLQDLIKSNNTIELRNKLEGASNHLSKQILKYWSQNKHLRMEFDVRPALPRDPPGMTSGTNIWGSVVDTRYHVSTELSSRSRGFVWFFSFLAWYSDTKRANESVILLLDEPGLTLHAKAQQDLLNYFEIELMPYHQLIYSTHSPFMIDSSHFDRVRIVQDKSIENENDKENKGTTVLTDIFTASSDSLFPLQGALGYELHQTLFIGPYNLIVEGAADLLYLQSMSALLQEEGGVGLDSRWTITPVGGASKIPTFVALLGSQKNIIIATLIDTKFSDQQSIENLYKEKLLRRQNVFTFANFTKSTEADIEDMFDVEFYVNLVNMEFSKQLIAPIEVTQLPKRSRILSAMENYFLSSPLKSGKFSHYRPAKCFSMNLDTLKRSVSINTKSRFSEAFSALNSLLN